MFDRCLAFGMPLVCFWYAFSLKNTVEASFTPTPWLHENRVHLNVKCYIGASILWLQMTWGRKTRWS